MRKPTIYGLLLCITLAFCLALALQGCATVPTMNPAMKMSAVASPEQEVGYKETIISQKIHLVSLAPYQGDLLNSFHHYQMSQASMLRGTRPSIASSQPDKPSRPLISFILFVKNCGNDPITISSDDVSVILESKSKEQPSAKIAVVSYQALINEMELTKMGILKSEIDTESSYSEIQSRRQSSASSSVDWTLINARNNEVNRLRNMGAEMQSIQQLMEKLVLKPQTLLPGESNSGLVVCDIGNININIEGDFQIVTFIGGEEHEFTFKRSPYDKKQ